jgi:hypothetical protein
VNGPVFLVCVAVIGGSLVAAFLICEAEWDRYCQWRDLHMPMWKREEARRALTRPRPFR